MTDSWLPEQAVLTRMARVREIAQLWCMVVAFEGVRGLRQ
jgi:hypothetical protein